MTKKLLLTAGVLLAMAFLVIKTVDIPQLLAVLRSLTLIDVSLLIGLTLSLEALKALRFFILLRDRNVEVGLGQSFRIYVSGESMSMLPGGESVRVLLLKKETNTSIVHSTAPALSTSLFDSVVAAIFVSIGAFLFSELGIAALIVDVLLIGGLLALLHPILFSRLVTGMAHIPKISGQVDFLMKVRGVLVNLLTAQNHRVLPGQATLYSLGISILSMGIGGYFFLYLIQLLGGEVSWMVAILLYASSIVIAAVSGFVPGGLGLTEGGITGILYALANLSYQQAISVALIYRGFTLGLYMLLGILTATIAYLPEIKRSGWKFLP